ncbi:MAG: glycosyltransferase [Desulfobacteraceae bacterium]|nr:glycosyltransferase [Desulfobacteraceae bacterium]MBC2720214.1 glycosyltransferase [Desulfobacteraceae bacterium]
MMIFYSIIIPAYNEEKWLPKTLDVLKKSMETVEAKGEIIVVDNNSTDNTSQIAKEYGVRLIYEPINRISSARNAGVKIAKGQFLIFLDADTFLSPDLLQKAISNLSSGKCCGGGVVIAAAEKALHPFAQKVVDLWNWISIKFGLAAGCFIYCLRKGFDDTGGFSELVYAGEEIFFSYFLKAWGKKKGLDFRIILSPPVLTSIRKLEWFTVYQMILRISFIVVFPYAIRFRIFCSSWYYRPKE